MRYGLVILAMLLLAACAERAERVPPETQPEGPCLQPGPEDETDGGVGGTGKRPDDCGELPL